MITELRKVDPEITGGVQVEVVDYRIRNYRLHNSLEQVSRLLLFCLECDSNNTSSKNLPSDTRKILSQWDIVKSEFEFGMEHNDVPTGSHEYAYSVVLPSGKEIQKIRNVKMKRVVTEIFNTARVMLSLDSANSQGYVAPEDADDIRTMFAVSDACFVRWIGSGEEDLGLNAPAYEKLGEILPDVDSDYSQILEPSRAMPKPKLDDVVDTQA
jgi:hypothetical protein